MRRREALGRRDTGEKGSGFKSRLVPLVRLRVVGKLS